PDETANMTEGHGTRLAVTPGGCPRPCSGTPPTEPATAGNRREPRIPWPSRPARQLDATDHSVALRSLSRADKQAARRAIPTPEWPSGRARAWPGPRARVRHAPRIRTGKPRVAEPVGGVRRPPDAHSAPGPAPQRNGDSELRAAHRFLPQNE